MADKDAGQAANDIDDDGDDDHCRTEPLYWIGGAAQDPCCVPDRHAEDCRESQNSKQPGLDKSGQKAVVKVIETLVRPKSLLEPLLCKRPAGGNAVAEKWGFAKCIETYVPQSNPQSEWSGMIAFGGECLPVIEKEMSAIHDDRKRNCRR